MAYPAVQTISHGSGTSSTTSHSVSLPSGIATGDRLILIIANDKYSGANPTASGWTYEGGQEVESPPTRNYPRAGVLSRVADGSEGSSVTVTTDTSKYASWIVLRLTGVTSIAAVVSSITQGTTNPDPPATGTVTSSNNMSIAIGMSNNETATVSSYPSGYSSNQTYEASGDSTGVCIALATKEFSGTSEDPGTYTMSASADVGAITIALIGSSGSPGSGLITEDDDTASGDGRSVNHGSGSIDEDDDTATGTGNVTNGGTGLIEEDDDTASGTGSLVNHGTGSIEEDDDTASGFGSNGTISSVIHEDDDTASGTGGFTNHGTGLIYAEDDTAFSPSYSATTPGHHCCCKCLIAEDDFNRADGDPGSLWYGDGVIASNVLEADNDSVTVCHPGFAPQGSIYATCKLIGTTDGAIYKIRVGDPNGSLEVHVEFSGTVGTGDYTITVTDGDSATDDETYDFQWQNEDEGIIICYQPKIQLSAGPSTRSPAISGEAEWVTMCINKIGKFCWKRDGVSVGNWMFMEGTFDDFRMEVNWIEKLSCPKCNCLCTEMTGTEKHFRCIPKKLYLTITETNCPGIDGTYEMDQVFVDSMPLYDPPVSEPWPQKYQWISEIVTCPTQSNEVHALVFILQCTDNTGGVYPSFELTVVRFGTGAFACSHLFFDPDDPDTVFTRLDYTEETPATIAKAKSSSTCEPFYLEFPYLTEDGITCSTSTACCGGYVASGGPEGGGFVSDPSFFGITITE